MILVCAPWVAAASASVPQKIRFDIPASALEEALNKFSAQADINVVFLKDRVKGMRTHALHGLYTREDAVRHLISSNNLCFDFGEDQSSVTVHSCADAHEPTESRKRVPGGSGPPKPRS